MHNGTDEAIMFEGESTTITELVEANEDTFTPEEIDAMRALKPGESIRFDFGAHGIFEVSR
jgi:hypothetical protein